MNSKKHVLRILSATFFLLLLILNTSVAMQGASDGIELCINAVLPSLFPFFILSAYLNRALLGSSIPGVHRIASSLNIPKGGDAFLLLGLIGGYPVGAQLLSQAYAQHQISRKTGNILLGYCSNAGPAFIFGMAGAFFSSKTIVFVLWGIHLISALITGYLLPRPQIESTNLNDNTSITVATALRLGLNICATTCGWIIVFRIILAYINFWFFDSIGGILFVIVSGIFELSNGCLLLEQISSEAIRFILFSSFLSFGGICVIMQTVSVTEHLGLGLYIPGKMLQTAISTTMATIISYVLFPDAQISLYLSGFTCVLCLVSFLITNRFLKKRYGN